MSRKDNNIEKIYLLTPMQEGMLFHSIIDESNAYFTQLFYKTKGQLDINVFSDSLDMLSKRHNILRTAFIQDKTEKPIQVVIKNRKILLTVKDKSALDDEQYNTFLAKYREEDINKGFDLVNEPLIRLTVFKRSNDSFDFLWSYHHILLDGWCHATLIEELGHIYHSLINKQEITLPLPVPFDLYVNWLGKRNTQLSKEYWKDYLKGYDAPAEIPKVIRERKNENARQKKVLTFDKGVTQSLETIAQERNITLNDVFQSLWGVLLAKYCNTNDVVYGNVVSGRPSEIEGIERCLGLFINTIPVRLTFKDTDSFIELVKKTHKESIDGLSHHYNSLADIQNDSELKGNLIKHIIAFENYPLETFNDEETDEGFLKISNVDVFEQTNYDFDVEVEIRKKIKTAFYFNPTSYCPVYVEKMIESFEFLTEQFIRNPDAKISDIELLSEKNRKELLYTFNNGKVDLYNNDPINVRFQKQVVKHEKSVAVIHNEEQWSYAQLNKMANRIANLMIGQGVKSGDFVGIFMDRTPQLIASLLAIFKVGAVYVPLDTQNPLIRTAELIRDSKLKALISIKNQLLKLEGEGLKTSDLETIICLDKLSEEKLPLNNIVTHYDDLSTSSNNDPENLNEMDSWAYMLYTSGSTGKPKGAITRHNGAMNHILAEFEALELPDDFRFLQSASIASDISVWQILAPLLKGGCVVISDKEYLLDYEKTLALMQLNKITIAEFVPSYLNGFVDYILDLNPKENLLPNMQWMMMVGEEVPVKLVNDWLGLFPECKVLNGYGPCEASDDITQYIITAPLQDYMTKVPIGKPIANMNVFVLDKNEKLVPIGVPGEICVSGVGVGAGYFNEPEKTAVSFKNNPFEDTLGEVIYKTGDLGRWMPEGNLEFLGRIDRQVKIRGNRVELGEIESYIRNNQSIKNTHVTVYKNNTEDISLLAFLVLDDHSLESTTSESLLNKLDKENIRLQVTKKSQQGLPSYMQPTEYCIVSEIPLNLSDKVDEKKLLELYKLQKQQGETGLLQKEVQPCTTDTERQIKEIWEAVLNKTDISATDNFFDCGGHSLLAMRAKAAIVKKIGVNVDIRDLFRYTTLNKLAAFIDGNIKEEVFQEILVQERPDKIPLSYAQESLWFIDQLQGSTEYHISAALQFKGSLDSDILNSCLKEIIDRHEVLKSVVKNEKGKPYQEIIISKEWSMDVIKDGVSFTENKLNEKISSIISSPFDLSDSFKLRATLIEQSEEAHVLVLVMHHIASDGWSESILVDELMALYAAKINGEQVELPKLPFKYIDYVLWQQGNKDTLKEQITYWKDKLDNVSILELPTDFERPQEQSTKGASVKYTIEAKTIEKLKEISSTQGTTMFMTLLAAFKVLMYRYTGQNDICVGIPIAGRTHQEFENLIGFFVNTLVIRDDLGANPKFIELLQQVKDTTLDAYKYQDAPFEKIVEATRTERDLSRNPLFQVMFTLQNTPEVKELALGDLIIDPIIQEEIQTPFDLHFNIEENPSKGVVLEVEYCTDLFRRTTIERMIGHFQILLDSIISNADKHIDSLEYIPQIEKNEILGKLAGSSEKLPDAYTIPYLFDQMVHKHPDGIAITDENKRLTYSELNNKANQLANLLIKEHAPNSQDTIGIVMSRGLDFVISMLAILKSGCSYLPIDVTKIPLERINYQLDKVNAKIFITDAISNITSLDDRYTGIHLDHSILAGQLEEYPKLNEIRTSSLAYVMFTSGTTGKPKGVTVSHQSVVRLVKDTNYTSLTREDKILQTGSLSFDAATFEIWGALLNGGEVCMVDINDLLDVEILSKSIKEKGITKLFITTSWFNQLVDIHAKIFHPLEQVLFGGEKVSPFHVQKAKNSCPKLRLTHCYGPTENTTFSICGDVGNNTEGDIPLGIPIANSTLYILDKNLQLLPKGVPGELMLGGIGLSGGYINDPEMTMDKFIPSPFIEGELLYKSGDIGSWMDDGQVVFHGRVDDQVKINGFRLEPSEISHTLMHHPDIKEALVRVFEKDNGEKALAGYYVSDKTLVDVDVKEYLVNILPPYMVPVLFFQIGRIPLNENGKVNKKLLPVPSIKIEDYQSADNEIEEQLVGIWSKLLGIAYTDISVTTNFFALGGHSLLAIQVITFIKSNFSVNIGIKDLFTHTTVRELARHIKTLEIKNDLPRIKVGIRPEQIPLSFSQERLWFIDKLEEGSAQYHMPSVFNINGSLDIEILEHAIVGVVNRHEVLRTVFMELNGVAFQEIQDTDNWYFEPAIKIDGLSEEEVRLVIEQEIDKPFDLHMDHMLRVTLLEKDGIAEKLIFTMHHIASDGWSLPIMLDELLELYHKKMLGKPFVLSSLDIQYADYSLWQRAYLSGNHLSDQLAYWRSKLSDVSPLNLPLDYVRPKNQSIEGSSLDFCLDNLLLEKLKALSQKEGTTLFMTLLSAFKVLMYRYSGQDDICIGTPTANREQQEVSGLIGFFVNTLALRSDLKGNPSFIELLSQVKQTTLEAYEHQQVPFEKIVSEVVSSRDLSRSPLFQVMFAMQNNASRELEASYGSDGFALEEVPFVDSTTLFDLSFDVIEKGDGLLISVEYCSKLFTNDTIKQLTFHFEQLLDAILVNPNEKIGALSMLSLKEEQKLLIDFNDTQVIHPQNKTLVDLFEDQVRNSPDSIALVFGDVELTYRELNEYSNQLAYYLLSKHNIGVEDLVGIKLDRSEWMIISILGVLKAGGAYVPIDPDYPKERISYIEEDSQCKITIDSSFIESIKKELETLDTNNIGVNILSNNLAYVIYTSGSTGAPKGVMIEHSSLLDYGKTFKDYFSLSSEDKILQQASIAFDTSIEEIFPILISGGSLVISENTKDVDQLLLECERKSISILSTNPYVLEYLNEYHENYKLQIRALISGGDVLKKDFISNIYNQYAIFNTYGPTESTVCSSYYHIKKLEFNIPIGEPISNRSIYLLSVYNQVVPVGVVGELCIGGAGLARGYLNREQLTSEKFVNNPFKEGERLYRTGDFGKWLPNGNIEFVGREDDQVMIRGYRIELGEIEKVLSGEDLIKNCCVLAKEDASGDKRLVGYVVSEKEFDRQVIVAHLKTKLPEYMIPQLWIEIEELPLTSNGKIDKKSLPNPDITTLLHMNYVAPTTEIEIGLSEFWQELLNVDQVGIYDDFFVLGGHSLLATRVATFIRSRFSVEVRIKDLFVNTTIKKLSEYIENQEETEFKKIVSGVRPELIPLSFAQERLWFIHKLEDGSAQYHMPGVFKIDGLLDIDILGRAIGDIVNRHEVLRTVYRETNGIAYQYIQKEDQWSFENTLSISGLKDTEVVEIIEREINKPFDLSNDHMLRITLLEDSGVISKLIITMHHIASDGWSLPIFLDELFVLYKSILSGKSHNLPRLAVQYADYSLWQREYLSGNQLSEQLEYWVSKLSGVTTLNLPLDYARPLKPSKRGNNLDINIDPSLVSGIKALSQQEGTTMFMTLLSAFKVLLYRYSGQTDICIGTPIANREQQEISSLVGFFVNTLALRSDLGGNPNFREVLSQIKETTLEAYEHQQVPFEKVVNEIVGFRDRSHNPLFDVMMVMQNNSGEDKDHLEINDLKFIEDQSSFEFSKYDLTFSFSEGTDGLTLSAEYRTELFSENKIKRMLGHFCTLLDSIISNEKEPIDTLEYIQQNEKDEILNELAGSSEELQDHYTIPYLFDQMVNEYPEDIAIIDEYNKLTYTDLNKKANQLANLLIKKHAPKPEDTIGIVMSRGIDFVVSMLAILKSGCGYLPIDVANVPLDRIDYQLNKSSAKVFITDAIFYKNSLKDKYAGIQLDDSILEDQLQKNPEINAIETSSLAYVMYTSGTTGKPKGAKVTHKGIVRLVKDTNYTSLSNKDKVLQTGSLSFDAATFEIWGPLLNGGQVHVMNLNDLLHIESLSKYIKEEGITKMWFTSSWFNQLVEIDEKIFNSLDQVLVGGEKLSQFHIQKVKSFSPELRVTNGYGPTENTTFSICGDIDNNVQKDIPLGIPITNTTLYILDKNLQVLPKGVPGELILGGVGVSSGYINDPERTAEKFIPSPFSEGELLYKSGDIGSWMEDGRVAFKGRVDDQVKINGFRLEPSEISHTLMCHPDIKKAIVTVFKKDNGEKALAGYYISDKKLEDLEIRTYLESLLPSYMLPTFLCQIEGIPVNENGKLDKKLLPVPTITIEDHQSPANELEEQLVTIWGEVLGIPLENISVTANFFALGGHSLLAMRTVFRIQLEIGILVDVGTLFNKPTIRQLSKVMSDMEDDIKYQAIEQVDYKQYHEVSQAQKRVWIADQVTQDRAVYNINIGLEIKGNLHIDILRNAIFKVIERHEILRTNFIEIDGIPYQVVNPFEENNCDFKVIETTDLLKDSQIALSREESHEFQLNKDALIRFRVLTNGEQYVLIVNLHHIIGDGWSIQTLQSDVLTAYKKLEASREYTFEPLTIQYKDYAVWHNKILLNDDKKAEEFWLNSLQGISQRPDLHVDKSRASIRSTEAKTCKFNFSSTVSKWINETAIANNVGKFVVLQTLVKIYLSDCLDSSDTIIGTPVPGRNHPQLEDQIGFYVNMLAIRTQVSDGESFNVLLKKVTKETKKAFQYQSYPFDFIINKLGLSRDLNRNQVFDVLISYMDGLQGKANVSGLEFIELETNNSDERNKYDITYSFETDPSGIISGAIIYNTNLFFDSSIEEMKTQLLSWSEMVLESPDTPLIDCIKLNNHSTCLVDDFS